MLLGDLYPKVGLYARAEDSYQIALAEAQLRNDPSAQAAALVGLAGQGRAAPETRWLVMGGSLSGRVIGGRRLSGGRAPRGFSGEGHASPCVASLSRKWKGQTLPPEIRCAEHQKPEGGETREITIRKPKLLHREFGKLP